MLLLPLSCGGEIVNPEEDALRTRQPSYATMPPPGFMLIGPADPNLQPGKILLPGTVLWP